MSESNLKHYKQRALKLKTQAFI